MCLIFPGVSRCTLIGSAQPGVLPANGDVLVVSPQPDESSIAVTELHRVVLAERNRDRPSDPGVRLIGTGGLSAIKNGIAAVPEIAIEGDPKAWLYIVAQVPFEGSDGLLFESVLAGKELVV